MWIRLGVIIIPLFLIAGGSHAIGFADAAGGLAELSFMTGCWQGSFQSRSGTGIIEEHYTTPSSNVMLGTTRYLMGERTVQFELTVIREDSSGVWLTPYPGGRRSEHDFRLTHVEDGQALFEAPEHDYPTRIWYTRDGESGLSARIDGGEGDAGRGWRLLRTDCF